MSAAEPGHDDWLERDPVLAQIVRRLVTAFSPERIYLFGSMARGDADRDSDYDLLVVAESKDPVHVRMARAQHALRGVPLPIDVFVCNQEEFARYSRWLGHTIAIAAREGRVIYG